MGAVIRLLLCMLLAACAAPPLPLPMPLPADAAPPPGTTADADAVPDKNGGAQSDAGKRRGMGRRRGWSALARTTIPAIDALVEGAIAEGKLPGAVVTVGRSDGIHFQQAYGHRSLVPEKTPMTVDTVFDLASLTKPLATATATMKLIEAGMLRLDDPLSRHLPELAGKRSGAITIMQLLLHTSGLPRVTPLRDYEADDAIARVLATRQERTAGARHHYSDVGYIWLGELIRRVSGRGLDQWTASIYGGFPTTRFTPTELPLERIAPTELTDKRPTELIHGEVHDPRAHRLGGVAGNAGLFSSADELALVARMLLQDGRLHGARLLTTESAQTMTRAQLVGRAVRTPGWDVRSGYSRHRGSKLSPRAFGHGGYTGVSMWIDPQLDLFVIFLSNRVHPDGQGDVIELAGNVADATVDALQPRPACPAPGAPVLAGIDVLLRDGAELHGLGMHPHVTHQRRRVGLLTHRAAVTRDGTTTLDALIHLLGPHLTTVFTPEHGLHADHEGPIDGAQPSHEGRPVHSLFGKTRRPTAAMLAQVDVLLVDLVDVGTRFYTYASTVEQVMRAGAEHGVPVLILDRPNPLGGLAVEGPLPDAGVQTFVHYHRLPVRHGMTLGELAALVASEKGIGVSLGVIEAEGWHRAMLQRQAALPFVPPSPNLPGEQAVLLYPALGLLESSNLSVGRGTDAPFQLVGAPWLEAEGLAAALDREQLPGLRVGTTRFTPTARPHRGVECAGLRLEVTNPVAFRPVDTALALGRALSRLHPADWEVEKLERMLRHAKAYRAVKRGARVGRVKALYAQELEAFVGRRARFLRYPVCGGGGEE